MLGRREPRHAGHPLRLHASTRLPDQPETALPLVALENLGRPVARTVVRRDHEVDTRMQVERDLRVHDVRLVAGEDGHDDPHLRANS